MSYPQLILLWLILIPWTSVHAMGLTTEIKGIDKDLLNNVQAFLSIYKESRIPDKLNSARINQLHKQAPAEIKRALQPFGYYAVKVDKSLERTEKAWRAIYNIELGPAISIKELSLKVSGSGSEDASFVELKENFPLKVGQTLNHAHYETAKQDWLKKALTKGYLDAKFVVREIKINLAEYFATIALQFDTGPQYRFGEVRFVQIGEQLDEQFLTRYVPFKSGDRYNTKALLELQTALSDSDHFSRVEINQHFEQVQNLLVPLEVNVTPRKPRKYRFGLGYGTDSGARASIEHQRRVSPKGHVLTLKGKTSEFINRVDMQYSMPLRRPASEQLTMTTHYLEQVTESRETKAGALDLRRITGRKRWRQALAITYEREDYEVADEKGSKQLLMPNFDWLHHEFNNRIYPTKGLRLTTELWLSSTLWRSDVDFLQLRFSGKWIYPLLTNGRFLLRLNAGGTLVEDVDQLPASKRFYAGGDQSIRGYGYEELGPEDAEGEIVGGKYLAVAGVEYEHRIAGNWGIAIFYDAGNSYNDALEKIYQGAGFGGRWRSKVGPIRLDLGWPLDKTVKYPRLHLVIGLDL